MFFLTLLIAFLNLRYILGSVPNPLPETCYSGGVKSNPCIGTACAPCWSQLPDGSWACFDLEASGQCKWGENVGSRIRDRGNVPNPNPSTPSTPTGINGGASTNSVAKNGTPAPTGLTRKYSSTEYVITTVTLTDSHEEMSARFALMSLVILIPIIFYI
ncbi:hypothetical protein DSO57_1005710 [Entomophthora muscae]|uniref:Uncharacterized protein n=1 Tax=Entomophthora muscae TaxID=34485 RepID=A0ACC2SKT3_9FUNG|nr:hypothetical protein DSO57_1005710 [Entomophthora muscae]